MCVRFGVFLSVLWFLARLGGSGALLAALGRSWGALGGSWGHLGRSWRLLVVPRAILEALGAALRATCWLSRGFGIHFWASWARLWGGFWSCFGDLF